jgi:hypothetical protein
VKNTVFMMSNRVLSRKAGNAETDNRIVFGKNDSAPLIGLLDMNGISPSRGKKS